MDWFKIQAYFAYICCTSIGQVHYKLLVGATENWNALAHWATGFQFFFLPLYLYMSPLANQCKYLLLTKFEGHAVSYGLSFFSPLIYGPSVKCVGHKLK